VIDFTNFGHIVVHEDTSSLGITVQFFPKHETGLKHMINLLDEYLKKNEIERSLVIRNDKRYPVPCVIIRGIYHG
jgi:hypothetical protein